MSKPTAAPWELHSAEEGREVENTGRYRIAIVADAPELLEALKRIANLDSRPRLASEVIELARAALAKAQAGQAKGGA